MPLFRKKPVVIEARQLTDRDWEEIGLWVDTEGSQVVGWAGPKSGSEIFLDISTLEGIMRANKGDWIIKGVNGEFYPCKPDIFEKTYDPA